MLKGCMHIMFDIVDTPFSYGKGLMSASHFRNFPRQKKVPAWDLKCRYCVFTLRGRSIDRHDRCIDLI